MGGERERLMREIVRHLLCVEKEKWGDFNNLQGEKLCITIENARSSVNRKREKIIDVYVREEDDWWLIRDKWFINR